MKDSEVLWNAGIFLFDIKTIIQESRDYCPEILNQLQEISIQNVRELRVSKDNYANIPSIAIDKAILEKTPNLSVVACDIDWDDIGTWKSFSKLCNLDENNNKTFGKVYSINTQNCTILNSENEHPIAAVGLSDLVIVQSSGSVLITNNEHCQDVKSLSQFPDLINNDYEKSYRPWGSYIVLDKGPNYKLKRIEVRSAGALSLQSHDHRDEHWTCVQGEVLVTLGDNVFTLKANESIFIPKKTKHRMQNLTQETAIIIEIQTGSHLAEDDIIRYQDIYNRHTLK